MFNLCKHKIVVADGTASAVPIGNGELNDRRLRQSKDDPYARYRLGDPKKTTPGDSSSGSLALGPGSEAGMGSDEDRRDEGRKLYNNWFGGKHDDLADRQTSDGGPGSSPFMSGGDGYGEPAVEGGFSDQTDSPLGATAKVQRETDPRGNLDNTNSNKRLPGSGGALQRFPETLRDHERRKAMLQRQTQRPKRKAAKVFNQISRRLEVSPLDTTWAHLKKGSAE